MKESSPSGKPSSVTSVTSVASRRNHNTYFVVLTEFEQNLMGCGCLLIMMTRLTEGDGPVGELLPVELPTEPVSAAIKPAAGRPPLPVIFE